MKSLIIDWIITPVYDIVWCYKMSDMPRSLAIFVAYEAERCIHKKVCLDDSA